MYVKRVWCSLRGILNLKRFRRVVMRVKAREEYLYVIKIVYGFDYVVDRVVL